METRRRPHNAKEKLLRLIASELDQVTADRLTGSVEFSLTLHLGQGGIRNIDAVVNITKRNIKL